jgi:hypothetical protein
VIFKAGIIIEEKEEKLLSIITLLLSDKYKNPGFPDGGWL